MLVSTIATSFIHNEEDQKHDETNTIDPEAHETSVLDASQGKLNPKP